MSGEEGSGDAADGPSRRDAIVAVAAQVFAAKGVASTTVRDIAQAAGILPGSLYHHFASREEIIDAVVSAPTAEMARTCRQVLVDHDDPLQRVRGLLVAAFRVFQLFPDSSTIYANDQSHLMSLERLRYVEEWRTEIEQIWLEVLRDGVARSVFRSDVRPELMYEVAQYPLRVTSGAYARSDRTPEELADERLTLLIDGYGA